MIFVICYFYLLIDSSRPISRTHINQCSSNNTCQALLFTQIAPFLGPPRYPEYVPSRIVAAQVNGTANFSVTYCSNPNPEWGWEFTSSNRTLSMKDGVEFIPDENTATIEIADVQEEHFGNYIITAENEHGTPTQPAVFMLLARGKNRNNYFLLMHH